jgi:hypothetical protein
LQERAAGVGDADAAQRARDRPQAPLGNGQLAVQVLVERTETLVGGARDREHLGTRERHGLDAAAGAARLRLQLQLAALRPAERARAGDRQAR